MNPKTWIALDIAIFIAAVFAFVCACVAWATRTEPITSMSGYLKARGYHGVQYIGTRSSMCPVGYESIGFAARDASGTRVSGAVCVHGDDIFLELD